MKRATAALLLFALLSACGGNSTPTSPTTGPLGPSGSSSPLAGFTLTGDPTASSGATWTYQATAGGTVYDLQGILMRPAGAGPFPAVIISHGAGGSANGYGRSIATQMVRWGLVCIATNYTHADDVPLGSPGTTAERGASAANVLRARKLVDILAALGYVDRSRIALFGFSMGAFVTTAVAGTHPDLFRAASHAAGGMLIDGYNQPAPTASQVAGVRLPYQMHHGDRDSVVPLAAEQQFAAALAARGVEHDLRIYPGAGHGDVSTNVTVLDRTREWFRSKGVL